jgi:glycosyltransferase involved in cell wall biosynthesis
MGANCSRHAKSGGSVKNRTVLFLASRSQSPSTRYRALAYFPHLRQAGWEPTLAIAHRQPWRWAGVLRMVARADVTVLCRRLFGPPLPRLLRLAARRLVFDFDDALMVRESGRPSGKRRRRFSRILRLCDQVWAGNSYLRTACVGLNDSVTVLPTSVEPAKYPPAAGGPRDALDLVWIGSSSTRKYLQGALPLLASAARPFPVLRLKVIADFETAAPGLRAISIPWDEASEGAELASAHIGIAPMPDDPWTRGKCGLKVLQYMAAGLPVIASDVGVHREIVTHGVTGFLPRSPSEWREAIVRLASDANLRTAMGHRGRRRLEERFSVEATFARMLRCLEAL